MDLVARVGNETANCEFILFSCDCCCFFCCLFEACSHALTPSPCTDIIFGCFLGLVVVGLLLICLGIGWNRARNTRDRLIRERGIKSASSVVACI
jgi:hypothetical protein